MTKSYLAMTPKYLSAHRKNTRLTLLSVLMSVALVTTVFSMLDILWRVETEQIIRDFGRYHIIVDHVTADEATAITNRIDVETAAPYIELDEALVDGRQVQIATIGDELALLFPQSFAVIQGTLPQADDEIVIEQWALAELGVSLGDTIEVSSASGVTKAFRICGICGDFSGTKAEAIPGLLVNLAGANVLDPQADAKLIVRFRDRVNVDDAEQEIMQRLGISPERISHNERLLAVEVRSVNRAVLQVYGTGIVLFLLVLVAGVTMIYNTFNISVMDRVRQFGLLRCIGASRKQITSLVKREGRYIALRAIPLGLFVGMVLSWACSAILVFYAGGFFADMSVLSISPVGLLAGIVIGVLTVSIACHRPAQKASRVSPVNAQLGGEDAPQQHKGRSALARGALPTETALGLRNAFSKRKTLALMSASIAISIVLFLGFQVLVSVMYAGMRTTKPYTPDISLTAEDSLSRDLYARLESVDGVERVYGRMFAYVPATFEAVKLPQAYREQIGDVVIGEDGLFTTAEESWLISYDANQLKWAKTDLLAGTLSEARLDEGDGIIAVVSNIRQGISTQATDLALGDQVYIDTISGRRAFTVMAILRSVPFADDRLNLATFITTEKQFTEITGDSTLRIISLQLKSKDQEQTVAQIRGLIDERITFHDLRQYNQEVTQMFITVAVFVYGFVIVIALISVLNIINTMQTSVASKTRYLGVMRAVGMSGTQLDKMIVAEAATYSLVGCLVGCILGIGLQHLLVTRVLVEMHLAWRFPGAQIAIILVLGLLTTVGAVIGPLKRVKAKGISETIGALE